MKMSKTNEKVVKEFFLEPEKKTPVNGIAVVEGLSRNGIFYPKEELKKFSRTMDGISIIKDHEAFTDNAIGVVEKGKSISEGVEVHYAGWIKDRGTAEKIKDGRVRHVSIGAIVEKLVKEDEDSEFLIAKGITCCELSTVIVPGVPKATIQQSLEAHGKAKTMKERLKIPAINEEVSKFIKLEEWKKENLSDLTKEPKTDGSEEKMKDKVKEDVNIETVNVNVETETKDEIQDKVNEEVKKKMSEEKINELETSLGTSKEELTKKEELLSEKDAEIAKLKEDLDKVAEEKKNALIEKYKNLCETKKVTEKDVSKLTEETLKVLVEQLEDVEAPAEAPAEEPAEEPEEEPAEEPETKGEVGDAEGEGEEATEESLMVERAEFGKGHSIFRETYDKDKFKRLAR